MRQLLIGCGSRRAKLVRHGEDDDWTELVTLDHNDDHKPDVVWDLNKRPLPFDDETFTEIHAYEVLEHLGNGIGDYRSWFAEWSEWYRLLTPGGYVCGTSPSLTSRWLFGDPSHTRAVSEEMLVFLIQPQYTQQVGTTAMSDFRFCYQADFDLIHSQDDKVSFSFAMQAVKPSRYSR